MKTLKHHVLIFDEACPLCRAYTGAFVKTGMLDEHGREAYNKMEEQTCNCIDKDRARNEIALVNTKTGNVLYGIDSLFRVIAHAFPVFAPLFRFTPFKWCMKKLYSFISYNRKVIIPGKETADSCIPDFNVKYRWAYIAFTWIISSFILTKYSVLLEGVIPASKFFREFIICGGQIVFQGVILLMLDHKKALTYLGNMMTISFSASLLLVLIGTVAKISGFVNPNFYAFLFLFIAGLMFLEHLRRMKLLEISWIASATWILYRLIVLFIVV
jgi:predicted DCC family thiol-disulfide oxidoreductase YuxK